MVNRAAVHLLRPLGAANKQRGITLPGKAKAAVELHRAVTGKHHDLVGGNFGHPACDLCVLIERLIPHHSRTVVHKRARILHADINIDRRVLERLIGENELAVLFTCFEILGDALQAFTGSAGCLGCGQ